MFEKVLVPLDGSELAEEVLETAVMLGKELVLLRVLVPSEELVTVVAGEGMNVAAYDERIHESAYEYLNGKAERWARPDLLVTPMVEVGHTPDIINRVAKNEGVDLILMSTHGRTGLKHLVYGSVTESVLKHAPCPVLAMRADRLIKNILVPLDGSVLSEKALLPALDFARKSEANVTLFSVEPLEIELFEETSGMYPQIETPTEKVLEVEDYLKMLCSKYSSDDVKVDWAVSVGSAAEEILAYAHDEGFDMIAMSTHGRTGLSRLFYGSVAENVLRHAVEAVLVVRPEA